MNLAPEAMLWGLPWARLCTCRRGLQAWNTNEVIMVEGGSRIKPCSFSHVTHEQKWSPFISLPPISFPPSLPPSVLLPPHPLPLPPAHRWTLTVSIALAWNSWYRPDWPWTQGDQHASTSRVLALKVCAIMSSSRVLLSLKIILLHVSEYFLHICVSIPWVCWPEEARGCQIPCGVLGSFELPCGCWGLNPRAEGTASALNHDLLI